MKRRNLIVGAFALPALSLIPSITQTSTNKFPLIGGPFVGYIFDEHVYEHKVMFTQLYTEIVSLSNLQPENQVELIIRKRPRLDFIHAHAPRSLMDAAKTIVDMETFTIVKHRYTPTKILEIPEGADAELVEANRRKFL